MQQKLSLFVQRSVFVWLLKKKLKYKPLLTLRSNIQGVLKEYGPSDYRLLLFTFRI